MAASNLQARHVLWAFLLPLFVGLASASASTPSGQRFGAWHVVSIVSTSGVSLGDPAAVLSQENDAGEMSVYWDAGGPVLIAIDVNDCDGEGTDFERSEFVEIEQWLQLSNGGANRLEENFTKWLGEARRACRSDLGLDRFQMDELPAAAADFSRRLRGLIVVS